MKERGIDISFIIPVYNGEAVIGRMLRSICRMPEEISYEILVTDDGSTDQTPEILKSLCSEIRELRVFTIQNSGQSRARNVGLSHAAGEFVFFADADDCILAEGLSKLYRKAKEGNYDVTGGTYFRIEPGKEKFLACKDLESGSISRDEGKLFHAFKAESAFGYIWNKLFKRSFLLEQELVFDDTISVYMEDQLFNLKAIANGAAYYFLNEPVYEYYFEGVSTTRKPDPEIAEKSVAMLKSYDRYLCEKEIRKENQDLFVPLFMRMSCWAAFKNISYEGASFSKIKNRLLLFSREKTFRPMFEDPESRKYIKTLPSFLQRRFFLLGFTLMRDRKEGLLSAIFVISSPVLKKAAERMVR